MSPPILKSQSPISVSFSKTLKLQTPGASPGDLVVVLVEGVSWFSTNAGAPSLPNHFRLLHSYQDAAGFRQLMWAKVPAGGWSQVVLTASPGMSLSGGWWGEAAVFGNVGYTQPGWIDIPGSAGDYAQTVRADVSAFTTIQVYMHIDFDVLDVANNWFYGWNNGDLGFGLDAANRPIFFVNNTLGNPIGNVAANADIPGLAQHRKVWLLALLDTVTGVITYQYSFDEADEWGSVFFHFTPLGTTVAGTNGGTTPRLTNSDTVFYGTRDAATTPFNGQVYGAVEFTDLNFSLFINFTDDLPGGTTLVGGDVIHYQPTGEDFPSYPFDDWRICDGICFPFGVHIPARFVDGPDRLIYHVFRGGRFGPGHVSDPIVGPSNWTPTKDRATNALGLYLKHVTRTLESDVSTTDTPVSADPNYNYGYHALVIRGRTDAPVLPVLPQPPNIRLGCADSYRALLTDITYTNVLDEAQWTAMRWGRVLDDISRAKATFPDELGGVHCLAKHGGLKAWKHGLIIERNDQQVWSGPITNVQRQGNSIVVDAADILVRYVRRLAIRDALETYLQADCGVLFYDLLAVHARLASDAWEFPIPQFNVNVPVDRVLKPKELKYAWDLASELLNSAVDAFVANGTLFVFEPGTGWVYQSNIRRTLPGAYNINYDLMYGTFTEEAWAERPSWSLDGMGQGNFFAVPTADSGEYGFRTYAVAEVPEAQLEYGVLDYVDTDPLEVPADQPASQTAAALSARARTLAALRGYAPMAIEGGSLSQKAPVNVDNLLPGSLWVLDVHDAGYGQLLAASRLRRVDVDVTRNADGSIVEKVMPVLEPPGWMGDLGE